ncbi:hypothetical protein [Nocardioides sp. SLBN-35]|uniref:hypothetical protein n=1 Tax=Nocardioides sp. SLBN-35 TaxID=2768445 RepID=UPI00114E13A1|nr:hypothetical protein [Nocardioides sp. SLBN-35]
MTRDQNRPPALLTIENVTTASPEVGNAVHLIRDSEWQRRPGPPRALCGVEMSRTGVSWFALAGCRKCAAYGLKRDLAEIIDTDGRTVSLQDVHNGIVRNID